MTDDLLGVPMYEAAAPAPVDRATATAVLAAVGDVETPGIPPVLLPVWSRPTAVAATDPLPLQLHFDLKARFGLPEGVMTSCRTTYLAPVHEGDVLTTVQILRSVAEPRRTRLGTGRDWVIDVEHRNQRGELVGTESWTGFGYAPAGP